MRRMVALADDPSFPLRSRLVHVQYRSLVADPVGTIARIYDAFGLELKREARAAMAAKVARAPNGGYGANHYRPEEFGIDPERERASVYAQRFGVETQTCTFRMLSVLSEPGRLRLSKLQSSAR